MKQPQWYHAIRERIRFFVFSKLPNGVVVVDERMTLAGAMEQVRVGGYILLKPNSPPSGLPIRNYKYK